MASLCDRRILITRTLHQASELAAQLEALGAVPVVIPAIEIVPPVSYAALDHAIAALDRFDWLLFTSANAVEVFSQRRTLHPTRESSTTPRTAVIGPATARAAAAASLTVDLIPQQYIAESLAEVLIPHARTPQGNPAKFLFVRAVEARDHLPETLRSAGAEVTLAEAYASRIPPESIPALQSLFASPDTWPHAITFTSASTVRNLFALLEAAGLTLPPGIALVTIGPITSQALRDHGHHPTAEATEPTIPALIHAIAASV